MEHRDTNDIVLDSMLPVWYWTLNTDPLGKGGLAVIKKLDIRITFDGTDFWLDTDIELLNEGQPTNKGPYDTMGEVFEHLGYWMGWMEDWEQIALMEDVGE